MRLFQLMISLICFNGYSQIDLPSHKTSFYWDVNNSPFKDVYEVSDLHMSIKYFDKYGLTKDMELKIYNWKREQIAHLNLDKTFGLNYYTISLEDISESWESDQLYLCEIYDEGKNRFEWQMKLLKQSDQNLLQVDIIVNPIHLECASLSESGVEFYGDIRNGKAPYLLRWYVMNNNKSEFLYQPTEEILQHVNETSFIRVDQQPDFYVMLYAKDACGNIGQKMVHLICEEGKKKINSLFVEPIQLPVSKSVNNK